MYAHTRLLLIMLLLLLLRHYTRGGVLSRHSATVAGVRVNSHLRVMCIIRRGCTEPYNMLFSSLLHAHCVKYTGSRANYSIILTEPRCFVVRRGRAKNQNTTHRLILLLCTIRDGSARQRCVRVYNSSLSSPRHSLSLLDVRIFELYNAHTHACTE